MWDAGFCTSPRSFSMILRRILLEGSYPMLPGSLLLGPQGVQALTIRSLQAYTGLNKAVHRFESGFVDWTSSRSGFVEFNLL